MTFNMTIGKFWFHLKNLSSPFQELISQAEGLDFGKKIYMKKVIEINSVIRQRELVPDFFIEFFELSFFMKNKSIGYWKPMPIYLYTPKEGNRFPFFRKSLKTKIS